MLILLQLTLNFFDRTETLTISSISCNNCGSVYSQGTDIRCGTDCKPSLALSENSRRQVKGTSEWLSYITLSKHIFRKPTILTLLSVRISVANWSNKLCTMSNWSMVTCPGWVASSQASLGVSSSKKLLLKKFTEIHLVLPPFVAYGVCYKVGVQFHCKH